MKNRLFTSTIREIKASLGRYLAILAIVALGVGFFGGLKVTKPAMIKTLDVYLDELRFYDYRLISTIGFEQEDIEALENDLKSGVDGIEAVEGSYFSDALCKIENESEAAYRIHSITDEINLLHLSSGRMPENDTECVIDDYMQFASLGDSVVITDNNNEDTLSMLKNHELTIVGTVRSPLYINFERGTTSIGTGKLSGFLYVSEDEFDSEYIPEVFVKTQCNAGCFTDAYDNYIDLRTDKVEEILNECVLNRFERIRNDAQEKIDDAQKELDTQEANASRELAEALEEIEDGEREIADGEKELEEGREEIRKGREELKKKEKQISLSKKELDEKAALLEAGKAFLDDNEYALNKATIEAGFLAIDDGNRQIVEAKKKLNRYEKELEEGASEIAEAKEELADGKEEYRKSKAEFESKVADAQRELADAQEELDKVEEPDTYVMGRDTNVGYACYEPNANIVASVANVFPVFFFAIAVLICMTTMNRMVEEQRVQIGVLKALGYSSTAIMWKYLFYAGSAAILGAVAGYIGGTRVLPQCIWQGYNIMYNMGPKVLYKSVPSIAILSILAALICATGSAYTSVIYELRDVPANLIRPKAPKNGKRIFLEYITPLWKRMKFLHKVSARNIIRYKKRFFMMVLGISGCTALVLTGLGLGDSIKGIAELQFDNIQIYDSDVIFTEEFKDSAADEISSIEGISDITYLRQVAADIEAKDKKTGTKSIMVITPKDSEALMHFLVLRDAKTHEAIGYPCEGEAVLTESMAEALDVSVNDTVVIRDSDMNTLEIRLSGITENHFQNFIYLPENTFVGTPSGCVYNSAWLDVMDTDENASHTEAGKNGLSHEVAAQIAKRSDVMNVTVMQDLKDRVGKMMVGMDFIVLVVIICAGALALIVLYNLTNININERIREIATIKVLGFYPGETSQYVFRENFVLTGIGALAGLPLGKALHAFVMYNIRIDMVSFNTYVAGKSYLLAVGITFGFAALVNFVMFFKLQKIDMAESLKTIE